MERHLLVLWTVSNNTDCKLICVSTFGFCHTLECRAKEKRDHVHVRDFSKLISLEARHHKGFHSRYLFCGKGSKSSEVPFSLALEQLMDVILPELHAGRVLDMYQLLEA